nr:DDRGK domain-containing protein 1-like [Rhipicephalus microplus]
MSDLIMILTGAISLVTIILIGLLVWRGSTSSEFLFNNIGTFRSPELVALSRTPTETLAECSLVREIDDDDEEDDEMLEDMVAMPEGKIGAKKRKKLEMKAEKRAQRERDLEDREERRQKQALDEERRKQEEQREKELEAEREAEEKRLKEEKEKQELEEYLKLKEAFSVEGEGFDAATEEEAQNKLQEFLDHIKKEKVVILEDLAAKFQLKTQECIDRVQALLADETLVGVIDDRGKFIYITRQELEEVAHFIKQRGRVSISELVDSSNSLINLTPAA